jgi:RNA exonuclease 1
MASDDDYEDGEVLEEGQEAEEPSASVSAASQPSALLPVPIANPRKRPHSILQASNASSVYDTRPPLTHRQPARYSSNANTHTVSSDRRPAEYQDDRAYNEDLVVKHPRQQPRSRVLLDFAAWMAAARNRKRMDVEDVQKLVLNVLRGGSRREKGRVSPYLLPSLTPDAELPTKVCVLLLGKMHPSVLQKYRAKLGFFDACSSVPLMLTKQEVNQIRRSEAPLPELLYKFPRPTVDTHELSADELFYAHELTFLMKHSAGFTDELVLLPAGTFTRKSQPLGGTWQLDGDLLHLKWRQLTAKTASAEETPTDQDTATEEEEDDAYTLDVLVSQDGSMHEFRTDPLTDETYAHKVPEHLAKKRRGDDKPRSIWLSLAKAIAVDVPRAADGTLLLHDQAQANGSSKLQQGSASASTNGSEEEKPLKKEDFAYYTLSLEEMKQHGYPTDVEEEQRQLLASTDGNTRDHYVKTRPRPTVNGSVPASASKDEEGEDDEEGESMETEETVAAASAGGDVIYALDCEMCETDIGMELTRVTVVDVKGAVVYDQLVKPQSTIINYHTEFSGISEETLRNTKYILADVQRDLVTRFLFEDTILVGHSLTSDLRAMRLVHPTIADTAILYPHQRGFPFRTSLKFLTKTYLKKDIQMQIQAGHDSAEDAIASLELLLLKVRQGPWFGIPEAVSSSGAFDSIVDKVLALEKTMTMLRLQNTDAPVEQTDAAPSAERKPWDLYASGDFKAVSQSPFHHAQAVKAKAEASSSPASSASASAILKVEDCSSWEVLKTSLRDALNAQQDDAAQHPDLCWLEIEPPSASAASCNDFVGKHEVWMAKQQAYCERADAFLQQVRDEVLPKGTLVVVVPQGDLSLLRYLKGLRTRSKWRDATPSSEDLAPEELHAAVGDAFRGAMDSCVFLMQK